MIGPPTANDDAASGLGTGHRWFDEVDRVVYRCLDGTNGAAVWRIEPLCDAAGKMEVAHMPSITVSTAWGSISGNIDAQADLNAALDGKQPTGNYATGGGSATGVNTGDQTNITGNAGTATKLAAPANINGVPFDGSANITIASAPAAWTDITRNLGAAKRSGTFDITGLTGLTAGKHVAISQSSAPIASKGNATDEPEFDMIRLTGRVLNATTIRATWNSTGVVVGDYAFSYLISG